MITETPRSFVVREIGTESGTHPEEHEANPIATEELQNEVLKDLDAINQYLEVNSATIDTYRDNEEEVYEEVDTEGKLRILDVAHSDIAAIQEIASERGIFNIEAAKKLTTAIAAVSHTEMGAEGIDPLLADLHAILEGVKEDNEYRHDQLLDAQSEEKRASDLHDAKEISLLITTYEERRGTSREINLEDLAKLMMLDEHLFDKIEAPVEQTPEQTPENEKPSPRKGALGTFVTRLLNRR